VVTEPSNQGYTALVATRTGNFVIVWGDQRNDNFELFAQRLDGDGNPVWSVNGIGITPSGSYQRATAVPDGSGGIIIAYVSADRQSIRAQNIIDSGNVNMFWDATGVALSENIGTSYAEIVAIQAEGGGAVIAWSDYVNGSMNVYSQKLNAAGEIQWTPGGVLAGGGSGDQDIEEPDLMVSDGAGGVIITYSDYDYQANIYDIYSQRIDSSGRILWGSKGGAVNTALEDQYIYSIVPDGKGGAFYVWEDYNSSDTSVFLTHLNANGIAEP
jgi:hypothetical protein